jgi:hypothetical protein
VPLTYSREKGFWIEGGLGFPGHGCPTMSLQARILRFRPRSATEGCPRQNRHLPKSWSSKP